VTDTIDNRYAVALYPWPGLPKGTWILATPDDLETFDSFHDALEAAERAVVEVPGAELTYGLLGWKDAA
jgi:hypothetical protein